MVPTVFSTCENEQTWLPIIKTSAINRYLMDSRGIVDEWLKRIRGMVTKMRILGGAHNFYKVEILFDLATSTGGVPYRLLFVCRNEGRFKRPRITLFKYRKRNALVGGEKVVFVKQICTHDSRVICIDCNPNTCCMQSFERMRFDGRSGACEPVAGGA